jgi:hypothetical protein
MVLPDESAGSWGRVVTLASAVVGPATIHCVPIPADVTGHAAMYWYPRTPPKENKPDDETEDPPCLGDCEYGPDIPTG